MLFGKFFGNYDFYLEQREKKKAELAAQPATVAKKQEQSVNKQIIAFSQKEKRYSQSEAEKLLPKIELNIREQEAMLKVLEAKIADPSNQTSFEASADMAKEYEEYKTTIAKLMVKWEQIMESLE